MTYFHLLNFLGVVNITAIGKSLEVTIIPNSGAKEVENKYSRFWNFFVSDTNAFFVKRLNKYLTVEVISCDLKLYLLLEWGTL